MSKYWFNTNQSGSASSRMANNLTNSTTLFSSVKVSANRQILSFKSSLINVASICRKTIGKLHRNLLEIANRFIPVVKQGAIEKISMLKDNIASGANRWFATAKDRISKLKDMRKNRAESDLETNVQNVVAYLKKIYSEIVQVLKDELREEVEVVEEKTVQETKIAKSIIIENIIYYKWQLLIGLILLSVATIVTLKVRKLLKIFNSEVEYANLITEVEKDPRKFAHFKSLDTAIQKRTYLNRLIKNGEVKYVRPTMKRKVKFVVGVIFQTIVNYLEPVWRSIGDVIETKISKAELLHDSTLKGLRKDECVVLEDFLLLVPLTSCRIYDGSWENLSATDLVNSILVIPQVIKLMIAKVIGFKHQTDLILVSQGINYRLELIPDNIVDLTFTILYSVLGAAIFGKRLAYMIMAIKLLPVARALFRVVKTGIECIAVEDISEFSTKIMNSIYVEQVRKCHTENDVINDWLKLKTSLATMYATAELENILQHVSLVEQASEQSKDRKSVV